jgi:hypothetical protein
MHNPPSPDEADSAACKRDLRDLRLEHRRTEMALLENFGVDFYQQRDVRKRHDQLFRNCARRQGPPARVAPKRCDIAMARSLKELSRGCWSSEWLLRIDASV